MIKFISKRLFNGVFVLLGVAIIVFLIFQVLPGDPVRMMMGQRSDIASREAVIKEYGLDKSLPVQLVHYLNDLSPISIHKETEDNQKKYEYTSVLSIGENNIVLKSPYLRRSFQSNRAVTEMIYDSLEGTLWLAITAIVFATILGIIIGVIAALKQNTWIDHFLISGSVIGISAPSFVAGTLIAFVFAWLLHDYTHLDLTGSLYEYDPFTGKRMVLKNLILPALTLGIRPLAIIVQLTRSSMLDVLGQDYIRTARAKGLSEWKVIRKHALKNALNPVITAISGWFASLMAGAFFIEYIFGWKGLGSVTVNAVFTLDFPVVMGGTMFVGLLFVFISIIVDILYAIIDPRIRLS